MDESYGGDDFRLRYYNSNEFDVKARRLYTKCENGGRMLSRPVPSYLDFKLWLMNHYEHKFRENLSEVLTIGQS